LDSYVNLIPRLARAGRLAAFLWLISVCSVVAQGVSGHRVLGVLGVDYVIDGNTAQVTVDLILSGQLVDHALITFDRPDHDFNVASGGAKAIGTLTMDVAQAPSPSSLKGDFTVRDAAGTSVPFHGELVTWTAPDSLILVTKQFFLAPLLEARTIVRNGAPSGAEVDFWSGDQELYSVTMLPPSPVAVIPMKLIDGDLQVQAGAKMTLTPPSSLAPGSVFLSCQFQTLTTPLT